MGTPTMWIFGFHPVREALRARPEAIGRVLIARSGADQRAQEIADLCEEEGVEVSRVDTAEISSRFDSSPWTVICRMIRVRYRASWRRSRTTTSTWSRAGKRSGAIPPRSAIPHCCSTG